MTRLMHGDGILYRMSRRVPWLGSQIGRAQNRALGLRHQADALGLEVTALREALITVVDATLEGSGETLLRARQEIMNHTDSAQYRGYYHSEEVLYWLHIPGWLAAWSQAAQPTRLLDIGAGYGTLAVFAAMVTGAEVRVLDTETHLLSQALRERHGIAVAQGNIEQTAIPWPESFDAVIMTEVIEHFNFHPVPTMRKIAQALRPGGSLFLSTPDADSWGRLERYSSYRDMPPPDPNVPTDDIHIYQFTEGELREVVADAGLEIKQLARAPGRWGYHLNVQAERVG
jgi:SAM-dependent methyltransferase